MTDNRPHYTRHLFGDFMRQQPDLSGQSFHANQSCAGSRVSNWYYPQHFGNYKTGFQWCQRQDNSFLSYRYTFSNFFGHQCPITRCCPATSKPMNIVVYLRTLGSCCFSQQALELDEIVFYVRRGHPAHQLPAAC